MGLLMSFVKLFFSPDDPDQNDLIAVTNHKRAIAIWRQWMGYSQLAVWAFIWWAIGAGSAIGIDALGSGFARAETVNRIEVQILSTSIMDDHIRFCKADTEDGKQYFAAMINKKLQEYYQLTGSSHPPLPSCADLQGVN